ncbi:MAG TPA: tripartite tricarboxylate transporter substrate binding protein [Usitatibacter sp.]|jgi:tripartite-type tricarboxylate transporter receptor subunit TctC|nr:tripartite tricarboxylate transporter substrate binding protein [Usitatibacter sp.]
MGIARAAATLTLGLSLLAAGIPAHAQAWPAKPVKIISVFPPGGSVDQVARVLAAHLTEQMHQQFIVEDRGGASGSIGTQVVASAPPDGYTFGVVFDTHAVNPLLLNLPFDTLKDLAPVMLIGTSPMAIVASSSQPYKDFREVLAAARAKPGSVSIGSIGTGSLGHLAIAQISKSQKLDITHVPYRGGGPLMTDAVGGQVPLAIGSVFLVTPHVKAGKLKALAVTSLEPSPQLPGVLPVAEQGMPGFSALSWWGVIAPAKTPQPIILKMHEELSRALKDPKVAKLLSDQGIEINGGGPAELDRWIRGETAKWALVVKENNIKAGD